MNRLEPQLDTKHWMNEFQTSGNMLDAFMATIALRTEKDARHLFSEVENVSIKMLHLVVNNGNGRCNLFYALNCRRNLIATRPIPLMRKKFISS